MKKIFALMFLLIPALCLHAQDSTGVKYLVNNPKISIGGFGSIFSETSILNNKISESMGAGAALIITDYFFIGGYGMTLTSNNYVNDLIIPSDINPDTMLFYNTKLRTSFSHAGIWVGGILFPRKRVHIGLSTRIGWGNVHLEKSNLSYLYNVNNLLDYTNNKVFVLTPQIELEVNITNWLKFNMGVGYRYVSGVDFDRFRSYKFNTPQITIGIYLGGFASREKNDDETNTKDTETDQ